MVSDRPVEVRLGVFVHQLAVLEPVRIEVEGVAVGVQAAEVGATVPNGDGVRVVDAVGLEVRKGEDNKKDK